MFFFRAFLFFLLAFFGLAPLWAQQGEDVDVEALRRQLIRQFPPGGKGGSEGRPASDIPASGQEPDVDALRRQLLEEFPLEREDQMPASESVGRVKQSVPVPLYKAHPPEKVLVGEVGRLYRLTRAELDTMADYVLDDSVLDRADLDAFDRQTLLMRRHKVEQTVLKDWVMRKTLVLLAQEQGIRVTDGEVSARLRDLEASLEVGRGVSDMQQAGMTTGDLRSDLRDALLIDKLIASEVEKRFSEAQLQEIYESDRSRYLQAPEVLVSQIVKYIPAGASYKEARRIEKDFEKVWKMTQKRDADFASLAEEYSDSEFGRARGGKVGWVEINVNSTFPPAVTDQLLKMGEGDVSPVIKVLHRRGGPDMPRETLHIVKVTSRRPARGLTFDDAARRAVLDDLAVRYKESTMAQLQRGATMLVQFDPEGLRVLP